MKYIILFFISLSSLSVLAETAVCTGQVERIAYHQPDAFYLKLGGAGIMKVCSPQAQYFRTGPESCKLIASLATTARATGKQLQVVIDNAPTTACSSIIEWSGADIRFIELYQ